MGIPRAVWACAGGGTVGSGLGSGEAFVRTFGPLPRGRDRPTCSLTTNSFWREMLLS